MKKIKILFQRFKMGLPPKIGVIRIFMPPMKSLVFWTFIFCFIVYDLMYLIPQKFNLSPDGWVFIFISFITIFFFGILMRGEGAIAGYRNIFPYLMNVFKHSEKLLSIKEISKKSDSEEDKKEIADLREDINALKEKMTEIESITFYRRKDSDHFAWPDPNDRKRIVEEYRAGKANGEIKNKESWAQSNYHIGAKTLKAYEDEFPIGNETIPKNI